MALLFSALFTVGLVAMMLWAIAMARTADADRRAVRVQEAEERRRADADAQLRKPGAALRCLNCDAAFAGPLPETGCPHCHLGSLVVTEMEYQRHQRGDNG